MKQNPQPPKEKGLSLGNKILNSIVKDQIKYHFQLPKFKVILNPFMPVIQLVFKKYLAELNNKQGQSIHINQQGMGLKDLTFKTNAINEQLPPLFPITLLKGIIGLIKLDLRHTLFTIENIDLFFGVKTIEEMKQFATSYKKMEITAEKLERMKLDCINSIIRQNSTNQSPAKEENNLNESLQILKKLLQKIRIVIKNISITVTVQDVNLTFVLSQIHWRMKKFTTEEIDKKESQGIYNISEKQDLQSNKIETENLKKNQTAFSSRKQERIQSALLLSELAFCGVTLHLTKKNEILKANDLELFMRTSCILSLSNIYNLQDQKFVHYQRMNLRMDVKEKMKFSSQIQLQSIEMQFTQSQFVETIKAIHILLLTQQILQSQFDIKMPNQILIEENHFEESEEISQNIKWALQSKIIKNYWDAIKIKQNGEEECQEKIIDYVGDSCQSEEKKKSSVIKLDVEEQGNPEKIIRVDSNNSEQLGQNQFTLNYSMDQSEINQSINSQQFDENQELLDISQQFNSSQFEGDVFQNLNNENNDFWDGKVILQFNLDNFLVVLKLSSTETIKEWKYSFIQNQKRLSFKCLSIFEEYIFEKFRCDYITFGLHFMKINIEKTNINQNQVQSEENIEFIKATKCTIGLVNLVEIQYEHYQPNHEQIKKSRERKDEKYKDQGKNFIKQTFDSEQQIFQQEQKEDELSNNDVFFRYFYISSVMEVSGLCETTQTFAMQESSNQLFYSCMEPTHQDLQDEITLAKAQLFNQRERHNYIFHPIFSINCSNFKNDQLSEEFNNNLVNLINIPNFPLIYLYTPTQQNFVQKNESKQAITLVFKHSIQSKQDEIPGQLLIYIENIDFNVTFQQLSIFKEIQIQTQIQVSSPSNQRQKVQQKSLINTIKINRFMFATFLRIPEATNLYFTSLIHSNQTHISNSRLRYQLQQNIQKCSIDYIKITFYEIKIQNQQLKNLTFKKAILANYFLDTNCINLSSLQIINKPIVQIDSMYLEKNKYILQPLIQLKQDKQIKKLISQMTWENVYQSSSIGLTMSFPIVNCFIDKTQLNFLFEANCFLQEIQQLLFPNTHQLDLQPQNHQFVSFFCDQIFINLYVQEAGQKIYDDQDYLKNGFPNVTNHKYENEERIKIHFSKVLGIYSDYQEVITGNKVKGRQFQLGVYNMVIADLKKYTNLEEHDIPRYKGQQNDELAQFLDFRSSKYDAKNIIFYKQERHNREVFKNCIILIDLFKNLDLQSILTQSQSEKYNPSKSSNIIYLSTTFFQILMDPNKEQNIFNFIFPMKTENCKTMHIIIKYAIINIDEYLEESINIIRNILKMKKQKNKSKQSKQQIKVIFNQQNIWLSMFPNFKDIVILKSFIEQKEIIQLIQSSENCVDQSYYSWVRFLLVIDQFKSEINQDSKNMNYYYKVICQVSKINFYIKMSTYLNLSTPNPILLLQPQQTIYKRNRKESDTIFEVDNEKNAILQHFNFSKICSFKSIQSSVVLNKQQQISINLDIKNIKSSLRKDCILAIWDLIGILQYIFVFKKYKKNSHQPYQQASQVLMESSPFIIESSDFKNSNQNFTIFQEKNEEVQDIVDQIIESKTLQIQFNLQKVEIKFYQGCIFVPEMFHFEDEEIRQSQIIENDQSIESLTGYEFYHLNFSNSNSRILEQEEQKNEEDLKQGYLLLVLENFNINYTKDYQENLELKLGNLQIKDEVPNTRFNVLISKESINLLPKEIQKDNFLDVIVQKSQKNIKQLGESGLHVNLKVKIFPIRICLYGGTLEFLYYLTTSPIKKQNINLDYFKHYTQKFTKRFEYYKMNEEADQQQSTPTTQQKVLLEMAHEIGYKVQFRKSMLISKNKYKLFNEAPLYAEKIYIEQIQIVVTFDGSGIQTNNLKKLFLKIASYDNLEINFQLALIKEHFFADNKELIKLLIDQYQKHISSQVKQKLFLQLKAVQNITNIISGQKSSFNQIISFKNLVSSVVEKGVLVGFSSGSVPLAKAVADELLYLAKKPIDVCETVTDRFCMNNIFRTVSKTLDNVYPIFFFFNYQKFYGCTIPSEFLKEK